MNRRRAIVIDCIVIMIMVVVVVKSMIYGFNDKNLLRVWIVWVIVCGSG